MAPEVKVGMLFVALILVAVPVVIFITGQWGWARSQHLTVYFPNVEGLSPGAKVVFLGVEVGRVRRIRLADPEELQPAAFEGRPVAVELMLRRDAQLLTTDQFTIVSAGLLGDNQIAVRRPSQKELERLARLQGREPPRPHLLPSGGRAAGDKAMGVADLGDQAHEVMEKVASALDDFHQVYAGAEVQERLPAILANVQDATRAATDFARTLARVSAENEARISNIAGEIAGAAGELNRTAQHVHQLVADTSPHVRHGTARMARMVDATAENMEAAGVQLEHTSRRVAALVDTSAGDIEASTRVARTTLEQTAGEVERAARHVADTTGVLEETTRLAAEDLTVTSARVRDLVGRSADSLETAAAQVEQATTAMAALVEETSAEISGGTRRVHEMVRKSAENVETAGAQFAQLAETAHADLAAITGRTRTMVDTSAADVQQTTARIARLTEISADDIERTTRRIHDLLATSPVFTDLGAAGAHIRRAASNIDALSGHFQSTLGDPEIAGRIKSTADNLEKASGHIAALSAEGEGLVTEGRDSLRKGMALATDEEMWENIRQAVVRLNTTMDDLAAITEHARGLFTDPELTEDLRATVRRTREITDLGVEMAEKADITLARVDDTMARVQGVTRQLRPTTTRGFLSAEKAESRRLRADIVADLYFGGEDADFWRMGLRDFGDANALIFQRGMGLGSGTTLRMGIMGGKLGGGLDYPLSNRSGAEFDLWDPADPRLDLRWTFSLGDPWRVLVGADDVFSGTRPYIGVRRSFGADTAPAEAGAR